MDNLSDLRIEPRELTARGFRFIKAPAALLLNRVGSATANIHPADFSDLLGRFGIDLIAERIETESTVVDLLDYDVRFGQGFLFSPPRPVRAEALQGAGGEGATPRSIGRCRCRRCAAASPNWSAPDVVDAVRAEAPSPSRSSHTTLPDIIERFAPLARDYDVLLCDVWGVVHNGVAAFPQACDALVAFSRRSRHGDPHHQRAARRRVGAADTRPARRAARCV